MSQQKEIGTLIVVVLKAQHLHQPSFYKQDPYVQASLSGLTKRTKVDPKGGQHPVWDDELRFPVLADVGKDKVNRVLEVSCYKDEQRGEDVLLGKGTVDIEETLKTGEFDDWVSLQTSAGARGEVYLEMTFYANSPPPLTRRPSKLNPSDRLARSATYYSQDLQLTPKATSPIASPQHGRSPTAADNKSNEPPATGGSQIPSSLIPAHGSHGQASRQAPPNGGATSVTAVKHRDDSLPPLPDDNDPINISSANNPGLPAALHPGGRGGPRPMPPQSRNQVISTGRRLPEILSNELHRGTLNDAPALHVVPPPPFSQLQTSVPSYSPEMTSMTSSRVGLAPSIFVEEPVEHHPPLVPPAPFSPPPWLIQEHEPRGVYVAGDYDSFPYGLPGQVFTQSNPQPYIPVATQGYPRTVSSSLRPMPLQSPHTPPGQSQQLYDPYVPKTSPLSHHQPYTPSGPPTPLPLSPLQVYPQMNSTQSQPQQSTYPPPQQQQQHLPSHQNLQQYHLQHVSYTQTPHPPQIYQLHQSSGLPPSDQSPVTAQQQSSLHCQISQQPYFVVPPPPPLLAQLQTPQPYASPPPHQHQSYFSPPPPPPPLYSQGGNAPPIPISVAQPSQTSVPPSAPSQELIPLPTPLPQSVAPITLQPPAIAPPPPQVDPNAGSTAAVAEAALTPREEVKGTLEDVTRNEKTEEQMEKTVEEEQKQLERLGDIEEQGMGEGREREQWIQEDRQRGEEKLQRREVLKGQEEQRLKQDMEQSKPEEEKHKRQEEEKQRKQEEKWKREAVEERRKREDEERRSREEQELGRKEEEVHQKKEEECRIWKQEERRRREEERRMREEEERRREEEEERKRREEEVHRKQERVQREREETERHRKAAEEEVHRRRAEEAEAERRWQEELARIRARAEQETADAAFARAQIEAEEAEQRRQEEADLALAQQAQEEAEREERLAQQRRRQEEADMEVARREQAHEEELERRRQEERRKSVEEADRELARKLDMELNLGAKSSPNGRDQSQQRKVGGSGRH